MLLLLRLMSSQDHILGKNLGQLEGIKSCGRDVSQ